MEILNIHISTYAHPVHMHALVWLCAWTTLYDLYATLQKYCKCECPVAESVAISESIHVWWGASVEAWATHCLECLWPLVSPLSVVTSFFVVTCALNLKHVAAYLMVWCLCRCCCWTYQFVFHSWRFLNNLNILDILSNLSSKWFELPLKGLQMVHGCFFICV